MNFRVKFIRIWGVLYSFQTSIETNTVLLALSLFLIKFIFLFIVSYLFSSYLIVLIVISRFENGQNSISFSRPKLSETVCSIQQI